VVLRVEGEGVAAGRPGAGGDLEAHGGLGIETGGEGVVGVRRRGPGTGVAVVGVRTAEHGAVADGEGRLAEQAARRRRARQRLVVLVDAQLARRGGGPRAPVVGVGERRACPVAPLALAL
jgi:hypothetical protein